MNWCMDDLASFGYPLADAGGVPDNYGLLETVVSPAWRHPQVSRSHLC